MNNRIPSAQSCLMPGWLRISPAVLGGLMNNWFNTVNSFLNTRNLLLSPFEKVRGSYKLNNLDFFFN